MTASSQITDPTLVAVVESAAQVRSQCAQILALLRKLSGANAVLPAPTQVQSESAALWAAQRALTAQLAQLRGQNRRAVQAVRATKAQTAEARHEVDGLHLRLQNLYYEQRHLRGEIAGCEEYAHRYLQLPMVPEEAFLQQHPEHAGSAAHELTVARIADEHAARLALEEARAALVRRKDALAKATGRKKDELAQLDAKLEKWVAAQGEVRGIFERREQKLAEAREREAEKDG